MKSFFFIESTELAPIDLAEQHLGLSEKNDSSPKKSAFFNSLIGFMQSLLIYFWL